MRSALPPAPPRAPEAVGQVWGCHRVQGTAGGTRGAESRVLGGVGGEGGGRSPTVEGCSLLSPTQRVRELGRRPAALRNGGWWSGHPALFLASCWGRAGPLRTLAHLAALPFSQPFPGSMPWLSLSPGPAANPSRCWGCRVWHLPASPSLHPQGIPVRAPRQVPDLLCCLVWVGGHPCSLVPRRWQSPCRGVTRWLQPWGSGLVPAFGGQSALGWRLGGGMLACFPEPEVSYCCCLFISSCKCAPRFGE